MDENTSESAAPTIPYNGIKQIRPTENTMKCKEEIIKLGTVVLLKKIA